MDVAPEAGDYPLFMVGTGDADVIVCREGQAIHRHLCAGGSAAPFEACLDGCLAPNFSLDLCPLRGPGEVVVYVFYCAGSFCGYPADVPQVAYAGYAPRSPVPIPESLV